MDDRKCSNYEGMLVDEYGIAYIDNTYSCGEIQPSVNESAKQLALETTKRWDEFIEDKDNKLFFESDAPLNDLAYDYNQFNMAKKAIDKLGGFAGLQKGAIVREYWLLFKYGNKVLRKIDAYNNSKNA